MKDEKKEPQLASAEYVDPLVKDLNGLDPEMSLLSVNFATTDNPYLNERHQEDSKE